MLTTGSLLRTFLLSSLLIGCAAGEDDSGDNGSKADDLAPGSDARAALLSAIHGELDERVHNQANEFVIDHIQAEDDFAFVTAQIQQPGGGDLDWTDSDWATDVEDGFFDGPFMQAFLRRDGRDGAWSVVELAVGPTDVWWTSLWTAFPTKNCSLFPAVDSLCSDVSEPERGSDARNGIVNSIHGVVDPAFNDQENQLVFSHIQASGDRAFATGFAQGPGGAELDIDDSIFADDEFFDGANFSAYLELNEEGNWDVAFSDIGATDVSWFGIWNRVEAPCGIFPVDSCEADPGSGNP